MVVVSEARRDEALAVAALECAPDAVLVVDPTGRIHLANAQAAALLGYSREELVGAFVDSLLPDALRAGHAAHRATYLAAPLPRPMEPGCVVSARTKAGAIVRVEVALSPLPTPEGLFVVASVRDATERLRAEDLAHDLRQPLNDIALAAQLLMQGTKGDAAAQKRASQIVQGTKCLDRMIHDLLDLSRFVRKPDT